MGLNIFLPEDKIFSQIKENNDKFSNSERNNFLYGFLGTNRTGKSVTAREIAEYWVEANPDGTVMAHDPQRRFVGVKDFDVDIRDDDWEKDILQLRNALLILDDFRLLYPKNIATKGLAELLYYRAEYNIDIIYIAHNPALILNILTYFTTHYFIFLTQSQQGSFEKKIPNYDLCQGASTYINKYVKLYGRGEYPNFPYMLIDNEKAEITAINMDKATGLDKIKQSII